ncbi:hypothetical protein [Enterobacter sp. ENT03]|uniref:hypothetical protein n=1 Tax=Enterobacter sp. ENT03 TaxID=2854780 RepID=UPI001C45DE9F|nr:hypothetical protein [Enterobacter sp. ENT03]MBV7404535.1 hypothetical protein [Enterobacter sp. ENT03]
MNEQQHKDLLAAMAAQTAAMMRLAESNEALAAMIYQSMVGEIETTTIDSPVHTYLSSKPRG